MKVKKDIIIRTVIEGVTMLCSVAAILIYAAAVGEMDDDPMDEGGFFAPMMVNLPTYTPTASSYVAPIVSSSSHVTGPKVAHRSFSSQLSDGVGAASGISAGSSMSYGGGWSSGVHITQVATGGPGGDGYGGGGGGGTGSSSSSGSSTHNYASVHIPMLNLGNGTFTTVASGIGHGKGPHLAGETADGGVYKGDAPGEITGTETQNLDNPIVNSYGQPIGDALLPLLLFAILYLIIKRKSMVQIISHILLLSKRSRACLWVLCALLLFPCTRAWAGQETITYKDVQGNDSLVTYNVVYLNSSTGDDGNEGSSSAPVKTLAKAYSKLPAFNTATDDRDDAWDSNIIVVAGSVALDKNVTESATGNRPATITGVWPWNATNTTVTKVDGGGRLTLSGVNSGGRIGADTKFKYVRFSNAGCLSLYLHDCTFDVGCLMNGSGELPTSNGALSGRKTANIQLFLLADPYEFSTTTTDGGWNSLMKKPVTLTMRSGKFGRILCTRITGTTVDPVSKRYVVGNPEKPLQAVINVDMDSATTEGSWNKGYVDDIAFLCAGTTQGTVYADVQMNIKRGKISSLVAGSQGNAIAACESAGVPTSTYIGRTTVNLIGKTDADVQIYRYFGGCLGRLTGDGASGECKAYFYGQSILNLTHGTIERDLYASAGGLSGLKNPNNDTQYTTDTRIPYQGGSKPNYPYMGIDYSAYSASKTIVSVKSDLYGTIETIDLAETKITFNINGGIIKGNVYGGSYGYSEDMTAGAAPTGAGSLWGNTEVNISGGTIQKSVYAGGGGTTQYYTTSTTDAMRAKYLTVATVYGSTHLTITGKPTIGGNIYGGGGGVAATGAVGTDTEYLNIAKVYGNTNVTINADEDWTFTGNIYGGGAMGAVTGNTNVQILGGKINGKVFAAGQGEEGHDDKAKIEGDPAITVEGGAISQNVYGGGEMAKVEGNTQVTVNGGSFGADIFGGGEGTLDGGGAVSMSADVSGETHVTINGGEFAVEYEDGNFAEHYNIYGGGNIASQVGESHVYVTKGMISNSSAGGSDFLDNDNADGIAKAYYHEGQMYFCIFGGGYGKNTSVTGNTWLDFHIAGMTDINSTAIEDDLLEYQSYLDVIGGGFNGTVQGNTNVHVGGNAMCRNVYGGGLYATIGNKGRGETGETHVHITGGNIDNVYGGGVMGDIMTSTNVNIGLKAASLSFDGRTHAQDNNKVTVLMSVYGGNDVSGHVPTANITHNGGRVEQNIYGAGNGDYTGYYTPNHCAYADGDNDNYFMVKHAGDDANSGPTYKGRPQTDNVNITLGGNSTTDKAVVLGQVFGGGNSCTIGTWKAIAKGDEHDGDPHAWRNDPSFFEGGGQLHITLGSHVKIGYDNTTLAAASDDIKAMYVRDDENVSGLFMGASGNVLATQSDADNYHHYYDAAAHQYKPGFASTDGADAFRAYLNNILVWTDDVQLTIANNAEDIWIANFVGGGFRGSMKRMTATNYAWTLPAGVTVGNCVLGGAYNADVKYKDSKLDLRYAGGLLASAGTNHADVVLTLNNQMDGGVNARVFGGCFSSGSVRNTQVDYRATGAHDVYGGGALANLTGNSVVNLLGGSLTNAYGGGLGSNDVAALVAGNATTTLNGSVVEGAIFGANNVNGTPQGHVKVHVLRTQKRAIRDSDPVAYEPYDVAAVYGGGNQAAYVPSQATFDANKGYAEVLIENCDNSIDYVYGGGNAAPVPATDVKIYGANAINNAFAGGNGKTEDGQPDNPGADIGYNGYYSQTAGETPTYGSGESHITVCGGTVHNVYGGSNTLGYVREHAYVYIKEYPDGYEDSKKCELHVDHTYAGGNEAEMFCGGSVTLACAEGANVVYAGSNEADIHGNIDLVISSGTYGKVFGGNNTKGNVYGHINVTIDETGCYPIMIGELYGCGNKAAYSVYGYYKNDDDDADEDNIGKPRTSGTKIYSDPTINLISFTSIGKVFGGGLGESAVVYGNPTININPIKGKFAGNNEVTPSYVLNSDNVRVTNSDAIEIPDAVGTIGTIYGGGNEAAVYGNTTVNIATKATNNHLNAEPGAEPEKVDAIITGNVYGGGSQADVHGNTNVTIGPSNTL